MVGLLGDTQVVTGFCKRAVDPPRPAVDDHQRRPVTGQEPVDDRLGEFRCVPVAVPRHDYPHTPVYHTVIALS